MKPITEPFDSAAPTAAFDPEPLFQCFEEAWQAGDVPSIADLLAKHDLSDTEQIPILEELVKVDLEYRWRQSVPSAEDDLPSKPLVEDYLRRFPILGSAVGPLLELIAEEYRSRRIWGDRPDAATYLERFPRHGDALDKRLARVDAELDVQTARVVASSMSDGRLPSRLVPDGYEILEELGRGGMGVVYKARQLRLNRVVALKMIVSGERAARHELERFRAEGEAAARLQHANVVPVYEVGEQDGQPYCVMEYVNGGTLAQRLSGSPLEANVAVGLLITLARAMQAVHEQGILHRDLKPANVLLALRGAEDVGIACLLSSDWCTPKISDFGLARRTGSAGLTQTGDVLGTPSYLAPEQAESRARDLGPPTDVYGLGAVFYELLTGRPPFRGVTVLDTLEQVRKHDPLPPRQIQPAVPRDVEIICLKCLHKDPRKRYARAADLADDLERFRQHQPIQARPVSLRERILKWAMRHPTSATVSVVLALTLIAVLFGGIVYTVNLRRAEAATRQEREQSTRNYNKALRAVEQMLVTMGAVNLEGVPGTEPMREEALNQAIQLYEDLQAERAEPDPDLYARLGFTLSYLGNLQREMSRFDEAEKTCRRAVELLERLPAEQLTTMTARRQAAFGRYVLGHVLIAVGKQEEAARRLRDALERFEILAAEGDDSSLWCEVSCLAAIAQLRVDLQTGLPAHRRALELSETYWHNNSNDWNAANLLGESSYNVSRDRQIAGRLEEAEKLQRRCLSVLEPLVVRVPRLSREHGFRYRSRSIVLHCYNALGLMLAGKGIKEEAETILRKALVLSEESARLYPHLECREEFAQSSTNLASVLAGSNRLAEAESLYRQAVSIRESLVREKRYSDPSALTLAETYSNLGLLLSASRSEEALLLFAKGRDLLEPLYRKVPDNPRCAIALSGVCSNRGQLLRNLGKLDEALTSHHRAIEVMQAAHRRDPANHEIQEQYVRALGTRGLTQLVRKEYKLSLTDWDRLLEVARDDADRYRVWRSLTLWEMGERAQAADEAEKALRCPKLMPDEHYNCVCILCRCLAAARDDPKRSPSERQATADRFASRALEELNRLQKSGYFKTPAGRETLKSDTDLDPLRSRDDFKSWLQTAN